MITLDRRTALMPICLSSFDHSWNSKTVILDIVVTIMASCLVVRGRVKK